MTIACVALISMPSCKKEHNAPPINETVNTNLNVDQTYSYTLPANANPEGFKISTQSSHASVSTIAKDASGNFVYNYTPTSGYTGADNVVISNGGEEHHGNCGGHHGNGQHKGKHHGSDDDDDDQEHTITININIGINH